MSSCGSCGSPVQPDDQFCGHCGYVLGPGDQADGGPGHEPVGDEPVGDEPVADEPVADEPVADEPVADEPATTADPAGGPAPVAADAEGSGFSDPDHPALFDRPARSLTPETVRVDLDDEPTSTGSDAPTEVVAVTGGVDLATCPSCGAVNAVERLRCARCGTPLHDDVDDTDADDWELQALPSADHEVDAATPPASGSRRSRGLGAIIVVVGAILGAGLAAWAFGVGPFERTPGVQVEFEGDRYPGQAEPVAPQRARTSEVQEDAGGRSFGAPSAVDGDLTTAWVAADPDEARLEFAFDRPVWITGIDVANGDQFDDETFEATARIRTVDMDFGFGTRMRATLISGTGWQVVRPPEPILTDRVMLDVVEVTEGTGVGMSEITFTGFPADDQDVQDWDEAN